MGKLSKQGIKERERLFGPGLRRGDFGKNKSELSLLNAASELVADAKKKKKKR